MPRHDTPPPLTRGVVLRGIGLTIAVALSGVAAWLIVTGKTQKRVEIGVLAGLWAALLGAFAMFGSRRFIHPLEQAQYAGTADSHSAELELRARSLELERAEDAAARRAYEARLEQMLRSEIEAAVARQITGLRAELATLRSELLEKVGGQLRLERIETTRVIGSDLEALQHEVRELKAVAAQDLVEYQSRPRPGDTGMFRQVVEQARVRPVSREAAEVEADVQPARVESTPVVEPTAAPAPPPPPPAPRPAETTGPIRTEAADRAPRPSPVPSSGTVEDLSALPRLTPFTDFELDPISEDAAYTGRRRRSDDAAASGVGEDAAGRHSRHSDEAGRRHRRDEEGDDDLLARLLAREGIRR